MKRLAAIVLLIILTANVAGFYVYYVISLKRIHSEMRASIRMLPEHKLTRLVLSRDLYKESLVEDDEIRLHGEMYDVARTSEEEDSIVVYALHDEKEESFMAFANEIMAKPFKPDQSVNTSVIGFIGLIFLPAQQVKKFQRDCLEIDHASVLHQSEAVQYKAIGSPPPESASAS
jgi:hypothetical protein